VSGRRPAMEIGEILGWALLGALLFGTLWAALRFDRAGRPSLVGDEATYAMQAASLACDFDLAYTRADYDRFVAQWGGQPDGLVLQSRDPGSGGRHITYGKPFLYALAIAPFVRLAPVRGALVANALFLAAAALLAARTLRRRLGGAAPFWVAVLVFAAVSFAYVYWVHADLFLFAAVAAGFALAYWEERPRAAPPADIYEGEEGEVGGRWFLVRWLAVGALLAIPGAFRPFYLALLLPAALAVPTGARRRAGLAALAAGALGLLLLTGLVQWQAGGAFSGYGGERQGFYPRTGYPEVDFPASGWEKSLRRWGNTSWTQEGAITPDFDAHLWGWNVLYFFVGRNIGILPYFLPLLLGFFAFSGERGRWAIPWAVLLAAAGFLLVRPFNFYGGGGAIGNRYFLPLYPALWFLAGRPLSARAATAAAGIAAALSALFLAPLWRHPTAYPIGPDGRYRHVSSFASRYLPYETTQSHIPGGEDSAHDGIWVKLLNGAMGRIGEAESLMGDEKGEVLVGSPEPLRALLAVADPRAPTRLETGGQILRPSLLRPNGTVVFRIELGAPRAVHPMWWTREPYYLYQLDLRLPGAPKVPIGVRLLPERNLIQRSGG
jgi:hypothetical protein